MLPDHGPERMVALNNFVHEVSQVGTTGFHLEDTVLVMRGDLPGTEGQEGDLIMILVDSRDGWVTIDLDTEELNADPDWPQIKAYLSEKVANGDAETVDRIDEDRIPAS